MGTKPRPADMTDLESILEKNTEIKYSEKWHPTSVSSFESELSVGAFKGMSRELRKNIAYSLQYLEFLQMEFAEIHLHDVIATEIIKTYVVTTMSIIEGIFHHLVISKGYRKKSEWKEIESPRHTNVFKENGVDKKFIVSTKIKLSTPESIQMDFEYLINKVQEKKLISLSGELFPKLKELKRLRNKVHIHVIRYENDTDYMGIDYYDYLQARIFLISVLKDKIFLPKQESCFDFIKLTDTEQEKWDEHTLNNNT